MKKAINIYQLCNNHKTLPSLQRNLLLKKHSINKNQMKRYLQFFLFFLAISSLSCSNDNHSGNSELVGKTFDHLFFETEQECIAAQTNPDFFTNCHEEIKFIDDETAQIMITDMVLSAHYTLEGNTINLYFSETETPALVFEIINNTSLKQSSNNTIWNQRTGDSIWD